MEIQVDQTTYHRYVHDQERCYLGQTVSCDFGWMMFFSKPVAYISIAGQDVKADHRVGIDAREFEDMGSDPRLT